MDKMFKWHLIYIIYIAYITKLIPVMTHKLAAAADTVNHELLQIIKSNMDFEKDPCDDFYQYACGNWERVHWDQNYVDTIGKLEYETNEELAQLLESVMHSEKSRQNVVYQKLQEHYLSCRENKHHDMRIYLDLLQPTGNETTWPTRLTEKGLSWQGRGFNWMETLGKLRTYGLNNVLIKEQLKNINATQLLIEFNKPDEVALNDEERRYYRALQRSVDINDHIEARKLELLWQKLQSLHLDFVDDKAPQLLTLSQLREKVPLLDVRAYLVQVLQLPVSDDMLLLVSNVAYLRRLVELLARTSKGTIARYIMLKLKAYLHTRLPESNTAQHCMQHLRQHMQLALDYMYDREHYAPYRRNQSDAVIQNVFSNMQSKFLQIIKQHAHEFSTKELDFLQQKIQLMRLNIGNLPSGVHDDYYALYYNDLQIQRHDFAKNFLSIMQHSQLRKHRQLHVHYLDAPELSYFNWHYASPAYKKALNLLIIPFAYLRQPIFHHHYHELFLYAELGNTLGHEMLHGFETNGLQFDAWGNPSTVFTHTMAKPHFQELLNCLRHEPTSDINEKIADFSGFRLAYETYFKRPHVPQFRLELALSNKQLFFVKFAQFFCAVSPNRIRYDESHDTPFKRVPQVVANQEEFTEVFNCSANARMNPSVKCNLW